MSLSGARILTTPNTGEAAALLFHGTADTLVPYQWALDTVAAAESADLLANLTTFEGAGHVPYTQNRTTILDQTTNFLYWTLDLTRGALSAGSGYRPVFLAPDRLLSNHLGARKPPRRLCGPCAGRV